MSAADESKRLGGKAISISDTIALARTLAEKKLDELGIKQAAK